MKWTAEQAPVMTTTARLIKIQAFAGTGKTTTLAGYAEAHPSERILYICYNKSVEQEAKGRFPKNVTSKTAHGLAFGSVGSKYQHKLVGNLRLTDIARLANTNNWELVKDILATLNNFMASDDDAITEDHYPRFKDKSKHTSKHRQIIDGALRNAMAIWKRMIDVNDSDCRATHDAYLKCWALRRPRLNAKFDTILVDEAQDLNPVIAGIVRRQVEAGCKVVVVGDPNQQLYRFRGAEDSLAAGWLIGAETHYLTESFRFGPAAAHVANVLLELKGETQKLKGLGSSTKVKTSLPADLPHRTFLHRTVAGVIETGLQLLATGQKMFWVGGIDSYSLSDLEDLHYFWRREKSKIKNFRLTQDYKDYEEYKQIADESEDLEMTRLCKMVEVHRDNLPELISLLRRSSTTDELESGVTLSTVHKSKGLQWDSVCICEDFTYDPLDPENDDPQRRADEINLLYVAATRAMQNLAINSMILMAMRDHVRRHGSLRPVASTSGA